MVLSLKKETKHTVVYSTDQKAVPIQSVYVEKDWLNSQALPGNTWPKQITLEVKVV